MPAGLAAHAGVTPLQHHRALVLALLAACVPALAQPADEPTLGEAIEAGTAQHNPLVFMAAPYVWAASMDGQAGIGNFSSDVDVGFIDFVSGADTIYGLQGHFELGRRPWAIFFDATWVHSEVDDLPGQIEATPADFDIASDTAILEFGGAWTFCHGQFEDDATRAARQWHLDAVGGARVTLMDLRVEATEDTPDPLPGGQSRREERDRDWVDPFIGVRGGMDFSQNWRGQARVDVGGFGVGSDFTWQVVALVGYDFEMFGADSTFFFGYRALGQDYEDDSGLNRFEWDVITHGPMLGLSLSF